MRGTLGAGGSEVSAWTLVPRRLQCQAPRPGLWRHVQAFPPGRFCPLQGLELFLARTAFPKSTPFLDLLMASGFHGPAARPLGGSFVRSLRCISTRASSRSLTPYRFSPRSPPGRGSSPFTHLLW